MACWCVGVRYGVEEKIAIEVVCRVRLEMDYRQLGGSDASLYKERAELCSQLTQYALNPP